MFRPMAYTRKMAFQLEEGLKRAGDLEVDVLDIENIMLGDLEEHVVKADGILVGSPTINQNTLLPVYKLFSVINPIRDKGKPAAAFGSFGWSGEAVGLIESHLKNLKLKVLTEGATARFLPSKEEAEDLIAFGEKFGRLLQEESTIGFIASGSVYSWPSVHLFRTSKSYRDPGEVRIFATGKWQIPEELPIPSPPAPRGP